MRLLIYHCHLPFANFHLTASLWQACQSLPEVTAEVAQPFAIRQQLSTFKPDVVLAFGGESLTAEGVQALRELSPKAKWVLWTTEDPFELEVNIEAAKAFDHVFTSDAGSVKAYPHPSVHWLPLAGDEAFFSHPVVAADELWYDLIFVGTAWPNRVAFLKELITSARKANLRTRFILPTNEFLSSEALEALGIARYERDYRISPRDLGMLQNRSLCTLALFRTFSRFTNKPCPQTSPTNRFYETALTGTVQVLATDDFRLNAFYPELNGAVVQETSAQAVVEQVLHLKADPKAREDAARWTQAFVQSTHLYQHRLATILDTLNVRP